MKNAQAKQVGFQIKGKFGKWITIMFLHNYTQKKINQDCDSLINSMIHSKYNGQYLTCHSVLGNIFIGKL